MTVMLLIEHYLEFLSLKGGSTSSSESTLVKIPHCWKSHVVAQMSNGGFCDREATKLYNNVTYLLLYMYVRQITRRHALSDSKLLFAPIRHFSSMAWLKGATNIASRPSVYPRLKLTNHDRWEYVS